MFHKIYEPQVGYWMQTSFAVQLKATQTPHVSLNQLKS